MSISGFAHTTELEFWPVIGGQDCTIQVEAIVIDREKGDPHSETQYSFEVRDCQGCSRAVARDWLRRNERFAVAQYHAKMKEETL
jgi:hypothetical protein